MRIIVAVFLFLSVNALAMDGGVGQQLIFNVQMNGFENLPVDQLAAPNVGVSQEAGEDSEASRYAGIATTEDGNEDENVNNEHDDLELINDLFRP